MFLIKKSRGGGEAGGVLGSASVCEWFDRDNGGRVVVSCGGLEQETDEVHVTINRCMIRSTCETRDTKTMRFNQRL